MQRELIIAELRKLSERELKQTLKVLSPLEREQVMAVVSVSVREPAKVSEPSFQALAGLSPWLLKAIGPEASGNLDARLTKATRSAIASALNELAAAASPPKGSALKRQDTMIGRWLSLRAQRSGAR